MYGWPTLGETRGQVLIALMNNDFIPDYVAGRPNLEGGLMFVTAQTGDTYAAVVKLDGAQSEQEEIQAAVDAGFIVRTRADSGLTGNADRRAAALASGAQLVTTDFPVEKNGYLLELPGGMPSRCNPVTAPADCQPRDIEDPVVIDACP